MADAAPMLPLGNAATHILCDAISDGVILIDENDRVTFVNDAAEALLMVSRRDLKGISAHGLMTECFGATATRLPRLRAGEHITCDGPARRGQHRPGAFQVCRLLLPVAAPCSTGDRPTAFIIRDMRPAQNLRTAERALDEALGRTSVPDPHSSTPSFGQAQLLQMLATETRNARGSATQLSAVLMQAPNRLDRDEVAELLDIGLRDSDRASMLRAPLAGTDFFETTSETKSTETNILALLGPESHWALFVLPETSSSGAAALMMRLRSLAANNKLRNIAFGSATMHNGIQAWGHEEDTPWTILRRALHQCQIDREIMEDEIFPQAA